MLRLSASNQIARGSDRPIDLTFTRKLGNARSMAGSVITISFFLNGAELVGWRLSTDSNLTRTQDLAATQQVTGVISRALISEIANQSRVNYFVSIEYGGLVEIDPEKYIGYFVVIDPSGSIQH